MNKRHGFSLVELLIVLILIGILSSYVVLKTSDSDALLVQGYANRFAQHIKHTQMLAMSWGKSLTMTVGSSGYQVSCSSTATLSPCNKTPVVDPANGQSFTINMGDNVSILDSGTIEFDALGRPLQSGGLSSGMTQWRIAKGGFQVTVNVNPISGSVSL